MEVVLGSTGLRVRKDGFGALPLQRADRETAARILAAALDGGITFFDTARAYTDSEEKLGRALGARRAGVVLATKTTAKTAANFWKDLDASLGLLKTDYIDVYQFHNPPVCPRPGDGSGLYEAAEEARRQGKIRFIGITNHRLPVAREAVESGLYATLQFPFSYLSNDAEIALTKRCAERGVGFIAMKALSGGLITDIAAARAWMNGLPNVVPIWGIQRETEIAALLAAARRDDPLTGAQRALIERDRAELRGAFCRGCGYCMPCPEGIEINTCARVALLLKRSPAARWLSPEWQAEMAKIRRCRHCGQCASRCPYGLDTPGLLERNLRDYEAALTAPLAAPLAASGAASAGSTAEAPRR